MQMSKTVRPRTLEDVDFLIKLAADAGLYQPTEGEIKAIMEGVEERKD